MSSKEEYIINMIKQMNIKDKLRLGIAMFSSSYINTDYNKKEFFEKMDNRLKQIDKTYIMSFSEIYNHTLIMFVTSKIMESTKEEQNRIAMFLVNCVWRKNKIKWRYSNFSDN